jgi:hypothetical protein
MTLFSPKCECCQSWKCVWIVSLITAGYIFLIDASFRASVLNLSVLALLAVSMSILGLGFLFLIGTILMSLCEKIKEIYLKYKVNKIW